MYEDQEQRKTPDGLFNWQENYYFIEEHFIQFTNCRIRAIVILLRNNICFKPNGNHFKSLRSNFLLLWRSIKNRKLNFTSRYSSDSPEIVKLIFFSNKLRGTYIANAYQEQEMSSEAIRNWRNVWTYTIKLAKN